VKPTPGEIQAADAFAKEVGLRRAAEEKLAEIRTHLESRRKAVGKYQAFLKTHEGALVLDEARGRIDGRADELESVLRFLDGKPAAKTAKAKTKGKAK
jgi:hypothetical protein